MERKPARSVSYGGILPVSGEYHRGHVRPGTGRTMSSEYEKMKLNELRELAKEKGIRGISTMRKPELVTLLSGQKDPEKKEMRSSEPAGKKTESSAERAAAGSKPRKERTAASATAGPAGSRKCIARRLGTVPSNPGGIPIRKTIRDRQRRHVRLRLRRKLRQKRSGRHRPPQSGPAMCPGSWRSCRKDLVFFVRKTIFPEAGMFMWDRI